MTLMVLSLTGPEPCGVYEAVQREMRDLRALISNTKPQCNEHIPPLGGDTASYSSSVTARSSEGHVPSKLEGGVC